MATTGGHMKHIIGTALAGAFIAVGALAAPPPATIVATEAGQVAGTAQGPVAAFLGVPFAAPPVGANRWRAPQPLAAWRGVRPARDFAASCYQMHPAPTFGPYTHEFVDTPAPDEDCLYLNVWTPASKGARLPVLVWIHGGGFLGGSGAVPIYDGARLAARGAVVVTINYRVGPFGFLAHPALSAEDPRHGSGNYGLQDQIAALRWIQRNIAGFGGDPGCVTIAGQSAGAASVNDLMVAPDATGLFQRAIAESGSGMGIDAAPLAQAEKDGLAFADYLGARTLAELRALPAARIQSGVYLPIAPGAAASKAPRLRFRPVLDGAVLPVDPNQPASRVSSLVPFITGYNADEALAPPTMTRADFEREVRTRYQAHADRLLALYPHATDAEAAASASLLARDRYMASLVLWAGARVKASGQILYAYRFDHAVPVAKPPGFGAFHTAEVPYLFGVLDTKLRPYGDEDRKVSAQVQAYWLNFMRNGDPNVGGQPAWPKVTADGRSVLSLGTQPGVRPAVSSPERFEALRAFVADGGALSLF